MNEYLLNTTIKIMLNVLFLRINNNTLDLKYE